MIHSVGASKIGYVGMTHFWPGWAQIAAGAQAPESVGAEPPPTHPHPTFTTIDSQYEPTFGVEAGRGLAVFEVELVAGCADARLGVGQRLRAPPMHGVLVVEVVGVLKRARHRHRRIYHRTARSLISSQLSSAHFIVTSQSRLL